LPYITPPNHVIDISYLGIFDSGIDLIEKKNYVPTKKIRDEYVLKEFFETLNLKKLVSELLEVGTNFKFYLDLPIAFITYKNKKGINGIYLNKVIKKLRPTINMHGFEYPTRIVLHLDLQGVLKMSFKQYIPCILNDRAQTKLANFYLYTHSKGFSTIMPFVTFNSQELLKICKEFNLLTTTLFLRYVDDPKLLDVIEK